ncbi:MAG: type II secretion protein F [Euryarchaeota archaeon]|nr:type II secretion protein F [Euryarchaeota archaeon]
MAHRDDRQKTTSAFGRFDTDLSDYTRKKIIKATDIERSKAPHTVRLTKGVVPYHEALTPYQRTARILMKPFVRRYFSHVSEGSKLEMDLTKAHMKFRVEDYLAYVWFSVFVMIGAVIGTGIALGALGIALHLSAVIMLLIYLGLGVAPLIGYFALMNLPASTANARRKDIDTRIPHAMSFISTLASADVTVDVIFSELAKQRIYGEIQNEAKWITRDIELLGKDVLSAIRDAAARSPSVKFQDFLQGVVTTTLSGGQLKPYFIMKSEQYNRLAKLEGKKGQETLGMLAESFVTVVVAMPLFLIVMMSLMALVGKTAGSSIMFLYLIVFLMIPLSQFGFIIAIQSMTAEAK